MNTSSSIPWLRRLQRRGGDCARWVLVIFLLLPFWAAAAISHTPVLPPPQAAFDYAQITSLKANPTIEGSATSSAPLIFVVLNKKGFIVYKDLSVFVTRNRFSETIYPPIANGGYVLSVRAGNVELASTTLTIGLRTVPTVELDDSLPSFDVSDGHLMRFKIHAAGLSGMAVGQLAFTILPDNADVADFQLYGYIDNNLTQSITSSADASSTDPLNSTLAEFGSTSPNVVIVPDQPIEIPAGQTYYFDLVGSVTPSDVSYAVETTLLGDRNAHFSDYTDLSSVSNFVWSPNTYGTSSPDDPDWLNASLVAGIPSTGLVEVRTSPPPSNAPTCTMSASTTTAPKGTPVTVTWSSNAATKAIWDTGTTTTLWGSSTYTLGSTTHTYILHFTGPYGQTDCYATVGVPFFLSSATSTGSTASTTDGFTATPATGNATLSVVFNGSVNNNKSCSAQTFSLGYGDHSTSTIAVAANACKAVTFTFTHNYSKVGTSTAMLFKGTGTSTTQRIQTQVIVVKTKVASLFDSVSNIAGAWSAVKENITETLQQFLLLFKW